MKKCDCGAVRAERHEHASWCSTQPEPVRLGKPGTQAARILLRAKGRAANDRLAVDLLRPCLARLARAAEVYMSVDPQMPTADADERELEEALEQAKLLLGDG